MRFSWKAIILAPLAAPTLVGLALAWSVTGQPLMTFCFFFGLAAAFSYGASVLVFLPCLYLCSRFVALTAWSTGVVGSGLGMVLYFPVGLVSYGTSGDDSGPPTGTFLQYLWQHSPGEAWAFVAGGLLTAMLYWFLAKPRATEKLAH